MQKEVPEAIAVPVAEPVVADGILRDDNGIYLGQWKTGIFDCFRHTVPNCCMAYWCPCVSLGQTMARVGPSGSIYMIAFGLLYLLSTGLSCSTVAYGPYYYYDSEGDVVWYNYSGSTGLWRTYFAPWPVVIASFLLIVARGSIRKLFKIPGNICEDCLCACCCSCCTLAQMATHVEAYTPNQCTFGFKDTLPGYSI